MGNSYSIIPYLYIRITIDYSHIYIDKETIKAIINPSIAHVSHITPYGSLYRIGYY